MLAFERESFQTPNLSQLNNLGAFTLMMLVPSYKLTKVIDLLNRPLILSTCISILVIRGGRMIPERSSQTKISQRTS